MPASMSYSWGRASFQTPWRSGCKPAATGSASSPSDRQVSDNPKMEKASGDWKRAVPFRLTGNVHYPSHFGPAHNLFAHVAQVKFVLWSTLKSPMPHPGGMRMPVEGADGSHHGCVELHIPHFGRMGMLTLEVAEHKWAPQLVRKPIACWGSWRSA